MNYNQLVFSLKIIRYSHCYAIINIALSFTIGMANFHCRQLIRAFELKSFLRFSAVV